MAWPLFGVAFVLLIWGRILLARAGASPDGSILEDVLMGAAFTSFPLIGAVVASRQPSNAYGWFLLGIGFNAGLLVWGMGSAAYFLADRAEPTTSGLLGAWIAGWMWFPLITLLPTFTLLLFPTGHLPSRRWRPVAWSAGFLIVAVSGLTMLDERLRGDGYSVRNPIGIIGFSDVEEKIQPGFILILSIAALCVASLFVRYRNAGVEERQQLKWFGLAGFVFFVGVALGDLFHLPSLLFPIVLLTLPIAIAVAVLKYRLYDIDLIINRALVYGALTAILAGTYFLIVVGMQRLLQNVTAESDLAVAASTLAVAALFRPVRSRVQWFIDRRFYRRKYDAQTTLEDFGTRLRQDVDLQHLKTDLLSVVTETVQPVTVSLWLRSETGSEAR